jgi:chemotaxis family two-component system sensor kinase Cph1
MTPNPADGSHKDQTLSTEGHELVANCAKQQLHLINAVQDFGCVLEINKSNRFISACSENTEAHLNLPPGELLGRHASSALGSRMARILAMSDESDGASRHFCTALIPDGPELHIAVTQGAHTWLVEFEHPAAGNEAHSAQKEMSFPRIGHQVSMQDIIVAFEKRFAELVPYDRMMVYQFDEDWSGKVIHEDNRGYEQSFLGLHFPASDLPANARDLYKKVPSRFIRDTQSPVYGLRHMTDGTTDLSLVRSRACSETHLRYLRNMSVRSSFSIAITQADALWGLIAFHARTPMALDAELRQKCERLARALSINLVRMQAEERMQTHENFNSYALSLLDSIDWKKPCPGCFLDVARHLKSALDASGAVIAYKGQLAQAGTTPSEDDVRVLLDIIPTLSKTRVHKLNSISRCLPDATRYATQAAGVLIASSVPLHEVTDDDLVFLWFRPEYVEQVRWAGKDEEVTGMTLDTGLRVLNPRNSFQVWTEERRNTCAEWGSETIYKATMWIHNLLDRDEL